MSLGLWLFLETHNPAEPSCFSAWLNGPRWTTNKYCRIHKQRIEGLDHFCEWLNVSIGRSNYIPFVLLLSLGCVQFTLQIAFGVLTFTSWREPLARAMEGSALVIFQIGAVLNILLSFNVLCLYVMLLQFHAYLGYRGMSTYDYTIEQTKLHKRSKAAAAGGAGSGDHGSGAKTAPDVESGTTKPAPAPGAGAV